MAPPNARSRTGLAAPGDWYALSGWTKLAHYQTMNYQYYHWWFEMWGYSFYPNTPFPLCGGYTVSANIRLNKILGDNDGTYYYSYDADLAGPSCTSLLSLFVQQRIF
jgi:hypothetical protein